MRNPSGQLIVYSSLAIVLLVLVWGLRQIPNEGRVADQVLRESLNQEIIVLNGAVKAATNALKYRLLDVLKAEGNDHATRAFQDSPFLAASLIEWDSSQWKALWFSNKSKTDLVNGEMKTWLRDWPLSKLALDEVYFTKVGDIEGQPYFAMLVPVRKPNQVPMVGVGIFPASQFGLGFSSDENREIRVFNASGSALALTHPAYLGSSVKGEAIVREMLEGEVVSLRHEWKSDAGVRMIGVGSRINDSNLYVAIETRATAPARLAAWAYLVLCAIGAGIVNWVLFNAVFKNVIAQLSSSEELTEKLRRQLSDATASRGPVPQAPEPVIPANELSELDFVEAIASAPLVRTPGQEEAEVQSSSVPQESFTAPILTDKMEPVQPAVSTLPSLDKVITASLRSMEKRIAENGVSVMRFGFDDLQFDGDPLQLQTAIEEVLKNSLEAMTDSSARNLTVSGRKLSDRVCILIEDSGHGVPEVNVEKVFDPFFSTRDAEGVARGLGLNVVRRVVEEMNGSVRLSSELGKGTRVEIDLPIAVKAATVVPASIPKVPTEINLDEDDEFAVAGLPVLPMEDREYLGIPIRKPKVRTLE